MRLTLFSVRNPLICNAVRFLYKEIEHAHRALEVDGHRGGLLLFAALKQKLFIKTFLFTNCTSSFKIILSLNLRMQTGA